LRPASLTCKCTSPYNPLMIWRPDLTVAAIAQRTDGRFLVVEERISGALVFNQPAGHVEDGESIPDAVIRETLEETAWHFVPQHLVGLYLWRNPANGRSILRVTFCGEAHSHDAARRLDRGIVAAHWLTRAELSAQPARLRSPLVLQCIDDYLAGRRHDLAALHHMVAASAPGT
jgi:8-oxo-dGTP pyrophosphatase MutT (NUDIX family)